MVINHRDLWMIIDSFDIDIYSNLSHQSLLIQSDISDKLSDEKPTAVKLSNHLFHLQQEKRVRFGILHWINIRDDNICNKVLISLGLKWCSVHCASYDGEYWSNNSRTLITHLGPNKGEEIHTHTQLWNLILTNCNVIMTLDFAPVLHSCANSRVDHFSSQRQCVWATGSVFISLFIYLCSQSILRVWHTELTDSQILSSRVWPAAL